MAIASWCGICSSSPWLNILRQNDIAPIDRNLKPSCRPLPRVFDFHPRQGFAERVRHQILSDGGTPRLSLDISFILLKRFPCAFVYVPVLEQLGAFWLQHGMQPQLIDHLLKRSWRRDDSRPYFRQVKSFEFLGEIHVESS